MANHQVANLIDKEGIGTAAERSELHEMHIVALLGTPLGSLQNACGIGPLGNVMHVVEVDILVANIVVGDDVDAHARNQVGHLVLDERVAVIGSAYKHNDQTMIVASFAKNILAEVGQTLFEEILRIDCLIDGIVDLFASFHTKVFQQLLALLAQQLFVLERDGRRDEFGHGTLHRLDDLAVTTDDGTIETVLTAIGPFIDDERQEDTLDATLHQVTNLAMHQLGRETDVVAHHHAGVTFVLAIVGRGRKDYVDACMGEEGMPEGEFLELVQGTRNAEGRGGEMF